MLGGVCRRWSTSSSGRWARRTLCSCACRPVSMTHHWLVTSPSGSVIYLHTSCFKFTTSRRRLPLHWTCRRPPGRRLMTTSPVCRDKRWRCDDCRATLFKRGLCPHVVSVCLSVTFVNSVKTNKHIFKVSSPLGSQAILVFWHQMAWQYSDGNPLTGAQMKVG